MPHVYCIHYIGARKRPGAHGLTTASCVPDNRRHARGQRRHQACRDAAAGRDHVHRFANGKIEEDWGVDAQWQMGEVWQ
jgi:hypothetical protein